MKFIFLFIFGTTFTDMRTTITFQTDSADKINLLIKVAHEMGVSTSADDVLLSKDEEGWMLLAEQTLARDWLCPEEDVWDDFIKSKLG